MNTIFRLSPLLALPSCLMAGPFDGAAGTLGSRAIPFDSTEIVGWATGYSNLIRGPARIDNPSLGFATFGEGSNALGPAGTSVFEVVSLGDGGSITLTFQAPITNGAGWDFAVFENSFNDTFLELAFVEVSSNGFDFFRFPAISLTPTDKQVDGFGSVDPTNIHNLAGKYRVGFGTPFNLEDLAGVSPLLDISSVTHVRIVDVVGVINSPFTTFDSLGNPINDPWATPFNSSGFDLDAVGVRYFIPEPSTIALLLAAASLLATGLLRTRRQP
jgi:hypothetical protein